MKTPLLHQKCVPCEGGTQPLVPDQYNAFLAQLTNWRVENQKVLIQERSAKNFIEVVALVNQIASLAEQEGHHPDLLIHDWNKLRISLSTHAIKGLSTNDFILAAKINEVLG